MNLLNMSVNCNLCLFLSLRLLFSKCGSYYRFKLVLMLSDSQCHCVVLYMHKMYLTTLCLTLVFTKNGVGVTVEVTEKNACNLVKI